MCPDDLAVAHETEVASVVLASVHLPKVGRNVLSSKAHLGSEKTLKYSGKKYSRDMQSSKCVSRLLEL